MSDMARMFFLAKAACNGGTAPAPSEVVILPETELTIPEGGQAYITTPLQSPVAAGDTVSITYNGTAYVCTGIAGEGVMFGNLAATGEGIAGGNPDAPFIVALVPGGFDMGDGISYGILLALDGATSITISIVQTEGAASGGESAGALVVTAVISGETTATLTVDSVSASHANMYAAIMSGRDVLCIATHPRITNPSAATDTTILRPVRVEEEVIILSCKTAMNSGFEIILQVAANGECAAMMSS